MTEAEWLECTDPVLMLAFLRGKASNRKLRLFACACCRDIWNLIQSGAGRRAVEASEEYADGLIRRKNLMEMRERARREESDLAQWAVMAASRPNVAATWVAMLATDAKDRTGIHMSYAPTRKPSPEQCSYLRDIFGIFPFRPVSIAPAWLAWNGGTLLGLARSVYEERAFDRLPILADALEDAGCDNADLLAHLRGPGPHCRGCWVVDLLLGKE